MVWFRNRTHNKSVFVRWVQSPPSRTCAYSITHSIGLHAKQTNYNLYQENHLRARTLQLTLDAEFDIFKAQIALHVLNLLNTQWCVQGEGDQCRVRFEGGQREPMDAPAAAHDPVQDQSDIAHQTDTREKGISLSYICPQLDVMFPQFICILTDY